MESLFVMVFLQFVFQTFFPLNGLAIQITLARRSRRSTTDYALTD